MLGKFIENNTIKLVIFSCLNFIFFQKLHAQQENVISLENQNIEFFSLLFDQSRFYENDKGSFYLPGDFKQLSRTKDALMLSFEKTFIINELEDEYEIVLEKGMMDQWMILINDKFINNTIS